MSLNHPEHLAQTRIEVLRAVLCPPGRGAVWSTHSGGARHGATLIFPGSESMCLSDATPAPSCGAGYGREMRVPKSSTARVGTPADQCGIRASASDFRQIYYITVQRGVVPHITYCSRDNATPARAKTFSVRLLALSVVFVATWASALSEKLALFAVVFVHLTP